MADMITEIPEDLTKYRALLKMSDEELQAKGVMHKVIKNIKMKKPVPLANDTIPLNNPISSDAYIKKEE
jgi:hypothetical protein